MSVANKPKTKADLVALIAEKSGLTKADAAKSLDATIAAITDIVTAKDSVLIPGLGKFFHQDKPEGTARNPSTGAEIKTEAKTVPKFKAAKGFSDAVNVK